MASHDQQLRNPLYRDWVKAGLSLKYLKDGIEEFVDDETKEQQKNILEEVQKKLGRPEATCNSCPIDQLLAHKRGRFKKGNFCPNDVCDKIFDKIVEQHMYGKPSWSNTDSTKWCTDHWEIAKCFLDGGGYSDKGSAADTDCKGLLSIITNSMFVQRNVDTPIDRLEPKKDVFSKSKKARNEILHHPSLQLSVETLNDYIDVMIQLLEDKGKLHEHENAKQAIAKLRQLKETDLNISTENEWEIRDAALKAVQERKQDALDEIEKKQDEILEKLQIDKIQETIDELSKTSKETSQSFSNRHESLEQKQILLESTFKKHHTEISKAVKELQQEMANLKTDFSDLKARFDAFDDIELQHKKRVTYLDHKKVLRQELFNLYSKYLSNLPVPPLLQKLDATVDEFYMELEICDDLVYEKRNENYYFRKPVTNYHEIFYKKGKRVENIYVLGDAGVGKTAWCLKLIYTWLQALKNQATECMHSLVSNEKLMLELEFVLFVSLRHASKEVDLTEMIRKQIFHQTPHLFEYMQEVIKTEPDKCLVIADGLDEWSAPDDQITSALGNDPSLPSRKNMNHCTILTTTRSWKMNEAKLDHSFIDRAVKINGFDGNDCVRGFAKKIIDKLNQNISLELNPRAKNEKKVEHFEQELHLRFPAQLFPYNGRVTQIPLIMILMVVKWFNDGCLGGTMAGNYSFMLKSLFEHEEGYRNIQPKYVRKQNFDGRLSRVSNIEEAKLEWSTDAEKLPECVRKHTVCSKYSRLILKLSDIAFEGLFDRKDKVLVFNEESLQEKLSSEEVEVAVKSGILSKSDVVGHVDMSKLSFLHKTVQEFLAAIHLVSHHEDGTCSSYQRFEKYCSNVHKIYEMENVILFISGLGANLTWQILKHVTNVENEETNSSQQSRGNNLDIEMYIWSSKSTFLGFVVKCIKELRGASYDAFMHMTPINSLNPKYIKCFDELLDLLEASVKASIKHVNVIMHLEQGLRPNKVLDYCSSEMFQFRQYMLEIIVDKKRLGLNRLLDMLSSEVFPLFNLTQLDLKHISGKCLCTRTDKKVVFNLNSLINLRLSHINKKNTSEKRFTNFVFDFSHSRNIVSVDLYAISSIQFNFSGKTLRELKLSHLKRCHVRINEDSAIQEAGNKQTISGDENGMSSLPCIMINYFCIQNCYKSKVGINFPGKYDKTSGMIAKITSLFCEESMFCEVEVDPNISIESVSLIKTDKNILEKRKKT